MQRRIDQSDGDWLSVHVTEEGLEISSLHWQQMVKRLPALFKVLCQNHGPEPLQAFGSKEHMFCTA